MQPWTMRSRQQCSEVCTSLLLFTALDLAACAGCYGSTKRYKSFDRLKKVNERTIIGASGELSDFQYILNMLDELSTEDYCMDDGTVLTPKEIFTYLTEVLYNRRNKCATDLALLAWHSLTSPAMCAN